MQARAAFACIAIAWSGAATSQTIVDPSVYQALARMGKVRMIVELGSGRISPAGDASWHISRVLTGYPDVAISPIDGDTAVVKTGSKDTVDKLAKDADVARIVLDTSVAVRNAMTNDENLEQVLTPPLTATGKGVAIAILDSGIDQNHPQLRDKVVSQACFSVFDPRFPSSCVAGKVTATDDIVDTSPAAATRCKSSDECLHATHVAGLIAGRATSSASGVATEADIVAVRIMDDAGTAFLSSILRGLTWIESKVLEYAATSRGPNIVAVNMSFGSAAIYVDRCDQDPQYVLISKKVGSLRDEGIVVFVSAGNSGAQGLGAPACLSATLPIGAIDEDGKLAQFTNRSKRAIYARGVNLRSAAPGGAYQPLSGTSMSTAIAAGAYLVLKGAFPKSSADDIEKALRDSSATIVEESSGVAYSVLDLEAAYALMTARQSKLPDVARSAR